MTMTRDEESVLLGLRADELALMELHAAVSELDKAKADVHPAAVLATLVCLENVATCARAAWWALAQRDGARPHRPVRGALFVRSPDGETTPADALTMALADLVEETPEPLPRVPVDLKRLVRTAHLVVQRAEYCGVVENADVAGGNPASIRFES